MALAATLSLFAFSIPSTFATPIYSSTSQLVFSSPQVSKSRPVPASLIYPLDYWTKEEGVGHFSEWSKATKRNFIDDVSAGKADNWTVVMGNEGGDLDSMAAALTWAYHLSHSHPDTPAVALLQTPMDALDLRPENKLALANVKMSPGHRDLLTIDELPIEAKELSSKLRGIVLVDHPVPLSIWKDARILSIFDHHTDRGIAKDTANPRIFERTASCTTIVSREMLDELEKLKEEYHVPHEVFELALSAIALDSDALSKGLPTDRLTSKRMFERSNFKLNDSRSFMDVMDDLDSQMGKAKKALDELSVRDLLRRDWKDQIERTLHNTTEEWFQVEEQWSHEISVDISLALNSFKEHVDRDGKVISRSLDWDDDEDADSEHPMTNDDGVEILKKRKVREIVLAVRNDHRINEEQADSLFKVVTDAIEKSEILAAKRWSREAELGKRQMVYVHHVESGGRKLIRPLVEDAISTWTM